MTLKVTYYSEYEIHKSIHTKVTHWYYTHGDLVIIFEDDELILQKIVLLDVETW